MLGRQIFKSEEDKTWINDGKRPAGKGWNGRNGSAENQCVQESASTTPSQEEGVAQVPISSVPSVPKSRSSQQELLAVDSDSVPIRVDGQPGWSMLRTTKLPASKNRNVLVKDPYGESRQVAAERITTENRSESMN